MTAINCPYCGRDISVHFPLSPAQRRVLEQVDPWRVQPTAAIADQAGYSRSYTALIIRQLRQMQLIESTGRKKGYIRPAYALELAV
jgi:hypothetical protein